MNGFVIVGGAKRDPIFGSCPGKIILGKIRAVDRARFLIAYQSQRTPIAFFAQHLRASRAGGASADDGDRSRVLRAGYLKVDIALSLDPDFAAVALDSEARNGVQRGSTLGLAGAQAESRVVPRAPNGFAHDQPFRQRTAVMRADGAGGKYILALP